MVQAMTEVTISTARAALPAALQPYAAAIRRDGPLLAIVAGYVIGTFLLCLALGKAEFFHPLVYMQMWVVGLVAGVGIFAFAYDLPQAIKADPRSPLTAFVRRLRARLTPKVAAGLVLFFAAGLFTGCFTTVKSLLNALAPFSWDARLADIDAALHLGVDPWRLLQPLLGHHAVTRAIQNLYLGGWAVMLVGFTAVAALSPKLAHVRTRFFLVYFGAWIVIGNLLAAVFMSGGPVFFGLITGDEARFSEQIRYLAFSAEAPNSSVQVANVLWDLYRNGEYHMGTGISAFPSMHVAMMTLFTLTAFQLDRRLGWAVGAFAALILMGSVHLGWHYAIDGYVSIALVTASWFGLGRLLPRRAP